MSDKKLYMVGNSHIDPVWFWEWDEGFQAVKATFASALDRLDEFDFVKFTATSSAFFEWIEKINPEMFEEIKKRVAEGRFDINGGWFVESDCHLPCGESLVRQGLYGQRYFLSRFNKICNVASCVDSFGHNGNLPQIHKKSGMDYYVVKRMYEKPLFVWEAPDGSRIPTFSMTAEYTTWFYEPTKKNIDDTLSKMGNFKELPCCYGVGNHGGGPTIENIKTINTLKEEYAKKDVELVYGTFTDFFKNLSEDEIDKLDVYKGSFEKYNVGCYSIDSKFKKANKFTENRLILAENMLIMEKLFTDKFNFDNQRMERLWKTVLFNQFHDAMGGTITKPARDEALMQLNGVSDESKRIQTFAIQNIANSIDTTGEGFPLFLFNPTGIDFEGTVHVELDWFCKDELILRDNNNNEIQYQRVHTLSKVRNWNLGGRRGIVFNAKIKAFGFVVYRTIIGETELCSDVRDGSHVSPYTIENDYIRVSFDKNTGLLNSIYDKENDYESLSAPITYDIWRDERDAWGGIQGRPFYKTHEKFVCEKLEMLEDGKIRKIVRGTYKHGSSYVIQHFVLNHEAKELVIESMLHWDKPWHMLKFNFPINVEDFTTKSEIAYNIQEREIRDNDEYYMHRFTDISENGAGLFIANDSKYAFSMEDNNFMLTILRSCIYAQGNGKKWFEPYYETYEYTDLGVQKFKIILRPHKNGISNKQKFQYANMVSNNILHLADSAHKGSKKCTEFSNIELNYENVIITTMKKAEDDDDLIIRLLEINGKNSKCTLKIANNKYDFEIKGNEIITLKINQQNGNFKVVNLLEM